MKELLAKIKEYCKNHNCSEGPCPFYFGDNPDTKSPICMFDDTPLFWELDKVDLSKFEEVF